MFKKVQKLITLLLCQLCMRISACQIALKSSHNNLYAYVNAGIWSCLLLSRYCFVFYIDKWIKLDQCRETNSAVVAIGLVINYP